ncbi:nose resistant to fluoxetine protein 6-like [Cloeon dipterum]|uniref:nose resistant to fluoxetine protein 6-like n=1 Tax=Cloeon dipterum TaxID=197152 RepID=UPI00321FA887
MTSTVSRCFFILLICCSSSGLNVFPNLEDIAKNARVVINDIASLIEEENCRSDLLTLADGIDKLDLWAMKMIDANGKWNPAFLLGNIKSLGSYEECVSIQQSKPYIKGKYCLANVHLSSNDEQIDSLLEIATQKRRNREITMNRTNTPVPDLLPSMALIQFGICVPSTCSIADVQKAFSYIISKEKSANGEAQIESCYTNGAAPLSSGDLAFIGCVAIIVGLVFLSSVIESNFGVKEDAGFAYSCLMAFSLPTNWRKLFFISNHPGALKSLDGIRVLSTLWVVAGHKIIFTLQEPWANKNFQVESLQKLANMPFINNMPSVDTFFLMSGMLRSYNLLKEFQGNRFRFFSDFARRYLRLTPVYALVIAFYATLLTRLGSGPRWEKFVTEPGEACAVNWKNNLLYINSYVHSNKHCMIQTWYLASDMQLFLVSPLVVYALWKKPVAGKWILFLMAAIPICFTAWYTYSYEVLPTYLLNNSDEKLISYQRDVHITTHHRMAPYVVGLALGYILYSKNRNFHLSPLRALFGWLMSLSTLYFVVFGAINIVQYDHEYDPVESTFYASLHRISWAFAVGWLIFACNNENGGWITKILSLNVFQPLSKISYCIYLSHYVILMVGTARIKTPLFADDYALIHSLAGDFIISFAVATVLYLSVEAPLFEITRLIFATSKSVNQKKEA